MTASATERGSRRYDKPPLSVGELVDRLQERGMVIPDRDRGSRYIRHIGYYRLSPYTIPFQQDRSQHTLTDGTTFDEILDLYVFDRALRLLVLDALERAEVAIRAALTDHMATTYTDSHWYLDPALFARAGKHTTFLKLVKKLYDDTLHHHADIGADEIVHKSALDHYVTTYGEPELPPSWLMVESLTLGQLASVIHNLRHRSDRTAIAHSLGLTDPLLLSWLKSYVRVRNICAHHGRLWNVGLGVYPAIPKSSQVSWPRSWGAVPDVSLRRLYPVLVSLQAVLNTVSPRSQWAERLQNLLSNRPALNLRGMGIPHGWSNDEFWGPSIGIDSPAGPRVGEIGDVEPS
ncbi:Abi family protein [Demequina sediminicola]|uniref:Abi family protein n=1 Tax=Demequina sediminicola TaxID=1095026 RepID=UPI000785AC03|nr:Abi family protein [Demequina sediminicola]